MDSPGIRIGGTVIRMEDNAEIVAAAVAAELRAERGAKKLTIAEVAQRAGMPEITLTRYLSNNRDIPVPKFLAICQALGVSGAIILERALKRIEHERQG